MVGEAAGARLVGLKTSAATPAEGCAAADARLAMLARGPDAIVFGMGVDGHAASWFPYAEGLAQALDPEGDGRVAAIRAEKSSVTGNNVDRLTLTLGYCLAAPVKILLTQGEFKKDAFAAACAAGPAEAMPVRALFDYAPDLWTCWAP